MKKLLLLSFTILQLATAQSQTITTIAGNGTAGYSGDGGAAVNALISHPNQLAFDQAGNLYIAEDYNNIIRKIDIFGNISTVAGNGNAGFSGDGFAAVNAELNRATGVAVDKFGNIYICDADNNRIRKVDTAGIISTIAGTGVDGYSGDSSLATAAEIGFCSSICLDTAGNIYFATQTTGYCIRKIDTAGIITTVAGTGVSGYNGDGILAVNAQLKAPAAVFMDASNNLYIGDLSGFRIRKVNAAGIISTIAGTGAAGSGGDGGPATSAQLFYPYGIVADAAGNVYICESGNNKIRRVSPSGQMSTFAGVGGFFGGYSGDGGSPLLAQFTNPSAITLDATGNVYVGDFGNSAVRKITPLISNISQEISDEVEANIYPNPSSTNLIIAFATEQINSIINIHNLLGEEIKTIRFTGKNCEISTVEMSEGVYILTVMNGNRSVLNRKIVVSKGRID